MTTHGHVMRAALRADMHLDWGMEANKKKYNFQVTSAVSAPSSPLSTAARLLCYDKQVQGTLRFLASSRLHALAQRCRRVPRDVQNRQHETHTHRHGLNPKAKGQLHPRVGRSSAAQQVSCRLNSYLFLENAALRSSARRRWRTAAVVRWPLNHSSGLASNGWGLS